VAAALLLLLLLLQQLLAAAAREPADQLAVQLRHGLRRGDGR
jgi:hypothetical protein